MNREKYFHQRRKKPLFFLFILLMVLIVSAIVMFLWNAIIPDITGWKPINYWQAMGLMALCKILCGRLGGHRDHGGRSHFRMNKFREKYTNATPEEREVLKQEWRNRCGGKNSE